MPTKKTTEAESNDNSGAELAWGTTAFSAGADVGLVARNTVGLIARDNPSTRQRLWKLVSDDASLDDILDELSSTGLKALPDFGIAQVEGADVRVVARGRTIISAELSSGETHEIDPSDVRTWIEEVVSDVAAITMSLPAEDGDEADADGETFAVLAGSVPARSLTRRFDAPDDHADVAESGAGWTTGDGPAPSDADQSGADDDDAHGFDESDEAGNSGVVDEIAAAPDVELELVDDIDADDESADESADDLADDLVDDESADDAVAPDADVAADPSAPGDEAAGETWFDDDDADADSGAIVPPQPDAPADPQPADPQPPAPPPPVASFDDAADPVVADFVPADPQPPAPPAGPSGPPPSGPGAGGPPPTDPSGAMLRGAGPEATIVVGSDDGPTRGPVSSIFDDAAAPISSAMPGDDLEATLGESELNDLQADPARTAPPVSDAPVYGVLVFSNGERIEVDRSVLIGRNPKVAGAVEGGLPHIMKFDGPGQGLSRTHAEVRVEDGGIVVEDLQSTNGTEVQLPGQQRRRLRGGEPVAVVPGTLIDFGDELHCTLESAS